MAGSLKNRVAARVIRESAGVKTEKSCVATRRLALRANAAIDGFIGGPGIKPELPGGFKN